MDVACHYTVPQTVHAELSSVQSGCISPACQPACIAKDVRRCKSQVRSPQHVGLAGASSPSTSGTSAWPQHLARADRR